MKKINTLKDVVEYQLCSGCGMCAADNNDIKMIDVLNIGRRPSGGGLSERPVPSYCPGVALSHIKSNHAEEISTELYDAWGPVLEVWQGFATDKAVRFASSSGGGITALTSYLLDEGQVSGVVHTGGDEKRPYLTKSVFSTTSSQVKSHAGSRYSASSPCEIIGKVQDQSKSFAFVGKPCDSAAVSLKAQDDKELADSLYVNISFFCAGTPSGQGNMNLIAREGLNPVDVNTLKYRGGGWPGLWRAVSSSISKELTYAESWGFLQKYRQWRCYVCVDHSGEFADISFGDPWHEAPKEGDLGKSMIVVRTEKGQKVLREAVEKGYITLEQQELSLLPDSQPNLLNARGALWGRLFALKLAGCPTPDYSGYSLFPFWRKELNLKEKFSSIAGTLKRIKTKSLNKRLR